MRAAYRNHSCRLHQYHCRGQRLLFLENDLLRVGVLVDKGADIFEFLFKPTDTDVMLHTPQGIRAPTVQSVASTAWGSFLDYYEGGWQEILPNGGPPCTYKGVEFGLHGEISTIPWQYRIAVDTVHAVEVEMLDQESGIQDQLCSAYGGINYIEMFEYPHSIVSSVLVPNSIWWELERRLVLIFLGRSHSSSDVHKRVIESLEHEGPDCQRLEDLRVTAGRSRDAVYAGDFGALGRAMIENTEAQGRLHPHLISEDAHRVIEIAEGFGALGWKVNGAGGEGGSVTILCEDKSYVKRQMIREIEKASPRYQNIPIYLSRYGVRIWEQEQSPSSRAAR